MNGILLAPSFEAAYAPVDAAQSLFHRELQLRPMKTVAALLLISIASAHSAFAQSSGSVPIQKAVKRAKAPASALRQTAESPSPPDCPIHSKGAATPAIRQVTLHKDLGEIYSVKCRLVDNGYPSDSYLVDIRSSSGKSLQKLVVQSPLDEEFFGTKFLDVTGDGYADLVISTSIAGGGPLVGADLYAFNPETHTFQLDSSFQGTSWPDLASTKGCVVTELKAGPGSYQASRSCYNLSARRWEVMERCDSVQDKSCTSRLMR